MLGWNTSASWLAGVALSTTSVAVVYAVMIEYGLNKTEYGKTVLAACFINDLGTVLALGFIFAPFTWHTLVFAAVAIAVFAVLPWLTPRFNRVFGNRPSEMEIKFLLFCLLGVGALAGWADSEVGTARTARRSRQANRIEQAPRGVRAISEGCHCSNAPTPDRQRGRPGRSWLGL